VDAFPLFPLFLVQYVNLVLLPYAYRSWKSNQPKFFHSDAHGYQVGSSVHGHNLQASGKCSPCMSRHLVLRNKGHLHAALCTLSLAQSRSIVQLSLVLEDRSRLEHFMGIAQSLRLGRGDPMASHDGPVAAAAAALPLLSRHDSDELSLPASSLGVSSQSSVGTGILGMLSWGSREASSLSGGDGHVHDSKQPLASITGYGFL
jgi:hypothetical protein